MPKYLEEKECPLSWQRLRLSSAVGSLSTQQASPSVEQQLRLRTSFAASIAPSSPPHVDCGEYVIIINADKAVLTGRKLEQKYYHHHSGYIGGLKSIQYKKMMATRPEMAMELAIKRMLPANTIGRKSMTRLHVYAGAEHAHAAQQPIVLD